MTRQDTIHWLILLAVSILIAEPGAARGDEQGKDALEEKLVKLREDLKSDQPGTRRAAATSLGKLARPSEDVVRALAECLDDADVTVAIAAADALAGFGQAAQATQPDLLKRFEDARRGPEGRPLWAAAASHFVK